MRSTGSAPRCLRIAVVGGGPGGLFAATQIRRAVPTADVTVVERDAVGETYGFGVVLSDRAVTRLGEADPRFATALSSACRRWEEIEVRLKGSRIRCAGNGMVAIERRRLLSLLAEGACAAGVRLRFGTEANLDDFAGHDLVVAADGVGSRIRRELADRLGVRDETGAARFAWYGTDQPFDSLTFLYERTANGIVAVHAYPISEHRSTFIVETDATTWQRAGLEGQGAVSYLEELFGAHLGGGNLITDGRVWGSFRTRYTDRWYVATPQPVALVGDAAHTAHFSVGSGTRMAMEDGVALAAALAAHPGDLRSAVEAYDAAAQPSVRRIQDAARSSLAWWERFALYHESMEPWQFAYHFLSRSTSDGELARRDPRFVAATRDHWVRRHGADVTSAPFRSGGWAVPGRLVHVERRDGVPEAVRGTHRLALGDRTHESASQRPAGVRVQAPDATADLGAAERAMDALAADPAGPPVLVAVYGGTSPTRTLLSEYARLRRGLPTLLVDPEADLDHAVTAVLSGRADLVAAARDHVW